MSVGLTLNGEARILEMAPQTPLLMALRNDFALNGPKYGCGLGKCGACCTGNQGKPSQWAERSESSIHSGKFLLRVNNDLLYG